MRRINTLSSAWCFSSPLSVSSRSLAIGGVCACVFLSLSVSVSLSASSLGQAIESVWQHGTILSHSVSIASLSFVISNYLTHYFPLSLSRILFAPFPVYKAGDVLINTCYSPCKLTTALHLSTLDMASLLDSSIQHRISIHPPQRFLRRAAPLLINYPRPALPGL